MRTFNPGNERTKWEFIHYLKGARGLCEDSITAHLQALSHFEAFTGYRGFESFDKVQAERFVDSLRTLRGKKGELLSVSTRKHTISQLRAFLE